MKEQSEEIKVRLTGDRTMTPSPDALVGLPLTLNIPQWNSLISQLFIESTLGFRHRARPWEQLKE